MVGRCGPWIISVGHISMVSCQKGPTRHAYAWQMGPFCQDTLDMCMRCVDYDKYNIISHTYWDYAHAIYVLYYELIIISHISHISHLLVHHIYLPAWHQAVNTLRLRQNGRHLADDIFKCIFLNEMFEIRLKLHWNLFPWFQWTIFQHWFA